VCSCEYAIFIGGRASFDIKKLAILVSSFDKVAAAENATPDRAFADSVFEYTSSHIIVCKQLDAAPVSFT
jgi:hypothetical protein